MWWPASSRAKLTAACFSGSCRSSGRILLILPPSVLLSHYDPPTKKISRPHPLYLGVDGKVAELKSAGEDLEIGKVLLLTALKR